MLKHIKTYTFSMVLAFFSLAAFNSYAVADEISDMLKGIDVGYGKLDLGGSLRYRYESFDNYNIKKYGTDKKDDVLLTRVRINVGYTLPQKIKVFVQLQDSRFFLSDLKKDDFGPSCPYLNELDLRQAFLQWRKIGNSPLGFRAGRQVIKYGDYRIFGPGDWGNVGRYTWDAGKVMLETAPFRVDFFAAKRVLYLKDEFDDEHFPYTVYAGYAQIRSIPKNKLDLFYIVKWDCDKTTKGVTGVGELLVQTIGFYGKGKWQRLDYASTFAYQFGDHGKDDISAFGFNAEAGYTPFDLWTPRVAASLSYASGTKNPKSDKYGTFDGVFGAIDKYYGRMNLFSWMNLIDLKLGVSVKPMKRMKLSLDYHHFNLAQKKDAWYYCTGKKMRWDPAGESGSDLGDEIDLIWKYHIHRRVTLMAGCAAFFPGDFVKATGSHENAYWGFGQIEIKI